ncbi:MAG: hypothetical protein ABI595_02465 [Actinomycetota bacterium]
MSEPRICVLCEEPLEPGVRDRARHLRAEHPSAHRALVLRLVTPWLYLAAVLAFLAFSLAIWVPIVALVAALGASFAFRRRAALEAGGVARPTPGQMLRAGGYGAMALVAVLFVIAFLSR